MKEPLTMRLTMTTTDADGVVISNTVQDYAQMGEEHVVAVEARVTGALVEMGIEKLAVKNPEAAAVIRGNVGKGKG